MLLLKPLSIFTLAFLMLVPNVAKAAEPIYTGIFSSTAVSGYDTVAYFTQNKPVKGSDEFTTEYMGATWKFSSKENLELFKANPTKYAPQYGGYCAYAVANETTASGDPKSWDIVDGKLYLNYSKSVQELWQDDKANYIDQANKNWPEVLK